MSHAFEGSVRLISSAGWEPVLMR